MINCINCEYCFHLYNQCTRANPDIRECDGFKKIERKICKDENDFYNNINSDDNCSTNLH